MEQCPCQSGKSFSDCCAIIHKKPQHAMKAEDLMRARYTAFANGNIDFVASTHVPGTEDFDQASAKEWSEGSTWKGLEIVKTEQGQPEHKKGLVEFKAYYGDSEGKDYVHHEVAQFKKIDDCWYYADGQIVGLGPLKRSEAKVGRNDPCSCGSGKKYKKCCAK